MSTKDLSYYLRLRYPVEAQESDKGYFVTHPDLDGCMAEGATLEDAIRNLADSRELWIEARLAGGYEIPEPEPETYSGRVSLRMTPELHGQLARLAIKRSVSLNLLMNSVLASYAGGAEPLMETLREMKSSLEQIRETASSVSGAPTTINSIGGSGSLPQSMGGPLDNVRPFRRNAGTTA